MIRTETVSCRLFAYPDNERKQMKTCYCTTIYSRTKMKTTNTSVYDDFFRPFSCYCVRDRDGAPLSANPTRRRTTSSYYLKTSCYFPSWCYWNCSS